MTVKGFSISPPSCAGSKARRGRKPCSAWSSCAFSTRCSTSRSTTLSKGYRHRTCLAQALVHDPEVLVMDEPTDGLEPEPEARGEKPDPQARQEQGDRVLDAYPGGGRRRMHARDHHRSRQDRRQRHARGAARHVRAGRRRGRCRRAALPRKSSPHWEEWSAWMEPSASIRATRRAPPSSRRASSSWFNREGWKVEGCTARRGSRRGVSAASPCPTR